jgi:hypothetical protein
MASEIEKWARIEREYIRDEIKWFKAGARLLSPSGDNITSAKVAELSARLEHVQQALEGA